MKKIAIGDKRFVITKNLIMMLVMLVVIFVAIFAWYSNNDTVTASGTQISAKSADNVELALPVKKADGTYSFPIENKEWKPEISFNLSEYLKNLVKDVTSNGEQFAVPNFEAASGLKDGRTVIADDVWEEGLSSKEALSNAKPLDDDQYNYISFDFYARAKSSDINVTSESFLAAGSELGFPDAEHPEGGVKPLVKRDNSSENSIYRTSTYGKGEGKEDSFSADAIVGAMRVSLIGAQVKSVNGNTETYSKKSGESYVNDTIWNTASKLQFLWLPRPDVYLNTDNQQNNWTLTTGINASDPLAEETYLHTFYEGNYVGEENNKIPKTLTKKSYFDSKVKQFTETKTITSPDYFHVSAASATGDKPYPTLGNSAKVTSDYENADVSTITFTKENDDNRETTGYYVYKYTLNIWIEGEDAEARRSMNNGVFSLELDFGT